jgi:hypothetical protein
MRTILHGFVGFLKALVWFLKTAVVVFLNIFITLYEYALKSVLFIALSVMKKTGITLSIHGKRRLVKLLKKVPLAKSWRNDCRKRRLYVERPFAISLRQTDAAYFVGMKSSEISTVLKAEPSVQGMMDFGEELFDWKNKRFHVECYFKRGICTGCYFYSRGRDGVLTEISSAPR